MAKGKWFDYYGERFDTVEINNTFYNLPKAETFDRWRDRTPRGFRYALKFSRYGSHMKKLKDPADSIGAFLDRAERLKAFLGPILVQLPPRWGANPERLEAFLGEAPRRRQWTVEFRDPGWLCEEVYRVLESFNAALCIHDMLKDHPRRLTADWTYLRFHGNGYAGSYSPQALSAWARWIEDRLDEGTAVYAYFNNDAEGHAVQNALDLRRYVLGGNGAKHF
jgi:uncharacterized protein YecE (DUF72 family)